jgi:probable HAF family extracellular repeat protein
MGANMKSKLLAELAAATLLVISVLPNYLAAQGNETGKSQHHHYKLVDIGTFGGPQSHVNPGSGNDTGNYASVLNSRGEVVGWAETSTPDPFPAFCFSDDCFVAHAFVLKNGAMMDLGALPGGASSAGNWISSNGLIAGVSENGTTDPLIPGVPELRATLWAHGRIIDLGSLPEGGFESVANAVNSQGHVVGSATNAVADPNSMVGSGFQTRAFLWRDGVMEDLGTLGTGTDAQAILINEKGQVVGWSYVNSVLTNACIPGFAFVTGSFIWDKEDGMRDLGSLGGTCTTATDMNNHGQVVGGSNLPGDVIQHGFLWDNGSFQDLGGSLGSSTGAYAINEAGNAVGFAFMPDNSTFHAVLWKQIGQLTDLGVVGSDQCSNADSINEAMQVVGSSLSDCNLEKANFRAFLWEDGSIFDLNALIPSDSSLYLQTTETINNRGEIAGVGVDQAGNEHAFLLIPCDENHPGIEGCDYSLVDPTSVASRTSSDSVPRDPSSVNQNLETSGPSPELLGSIASESNRVNRIFRQWPITTPRLSTRQAPVLVGAATTASPVITSGAPPNGTVGVQYGPATLESFKCFASPVLGWHQSCLPCSDFSGGCVSLPRCRGLFPSPCVKVETFYPGVVLTASGGRPPYFWSVSGLPPGLTINSQKGDISGIPTAVGTYHLIVTVADSSSPPLHGSASYSVTIFQ